MKKIQIICILLFAVQTFAQTQGPILPISSGYGSNGPYTIAVDSILNTSWPLDSVYTWVLHPAELSTKNPIIFFCHGFGAVNPKVYNSYITHMVSIGYTVVFPSYPTIIGGTSGLYDIMFNGFTQALNAFGNLMDTTKIGLVGHSLGAGAAPSLMLRCQAKGWGNSSRFLFLHAPWYSYSLSQSELHNFPSNCKLLMQVYEEDNINDHRMAADIFNNISIPPSEKDYMLIYSDTSTVFNYKLAAIHTTPIANPYGIGYDREDGLDYFGTWRLFDALADYSFNNNISAKEVALGNGSAIQKDFGTWPSPELRPVIKPYVSDVTFLLHNEDFYEWKWSSPANPRRDVASVNEKNIISNYSLEQNFPNPFNPTTHITYSIPFKSIVNFSIFNSLGQLIRENKAVLDAGIYQENFDGNKLSSGVYFYSLKAISINEGRQFSQTKKMILIK